MGKQIVYMQKLLFQLIALLLAFQAPARLRYGEWQEHLSYTHATKIALAGQKVYCVTEGGLFYYHTGDNSVNKISGMNGLNDFGIRTIAYNESHNVLVVAYQNSNIDLVYENSITNLSDIKRKQMTGDKNIYNISFHGDNAFLSCGFGIVVLNLSRKEIKETYIIGQEGSSIRVNDVEVFGSFIYAATNSGLFKADAGSPDLPDYRSWSPVEDIPFAGRKFNHLMIHSGELIANYTPDEYNQDAMYRLSGEEWVRYLPQIQYVGDAQVSGNYLAVASRAEFYLIDENHSSSGMINYYPFPGEMATPIAPRSIAVADNGSVLVADYGHGLVKIKGETAESVYPEGPMDNLIFSLYSNGDDLWVARGGRSDSWGPVWQSPRFYKFNGGDWTVFDEKNFPELKGVYDIVEIIASPSDADHLYVASWGSGLLEFDNGRLIERYTQNNSPLQTAVASDTTGVFVRIGGLDFDSEGNLWITNSDVEKNLLRLSADKKWQALMLPEVANNYNIGKVIVTRNDDKWIFLPRGNDAYVVDKTGTEKKRLLVTSYFNNGEQEILNRMNDIYCMTMDLEGDIWIGTSKGVAVYNNPHRIWDTENYYAIQPSLDLGDGLYHPLLETETVTAIVVDGANRKWIGTRNAGVYLVSENGEKEVAHFTSENSPLLSNNITALAINPNSGEIFVGTSEGLISYQGDAIRSNDAFTNVYVYPNPVRETWDGPVTVTGLKEDTDVKITDITGNLVYQSTSLGGQMVWDGRNLNGNRVKTGIYLIFCNDRNGEETHIEKLLFIH
jgi:hypothetical protein